MTLNDIVHHLHMKSLHATFYDYCEGRDMAKVGVSKHCFIRDQFPGVYSLCITQIYICLPIFNIIFLSMTYGVMAVTVHRRYKDDPL